MRLVVAALATCSAKVVLSTGGRLEVVRSSGVRTFKQEMWRVRVCVCGASALRAAGHHCERIPIILPSQSRRKMEENFSEKSVGLAICSTQLVSDCHAGGNTSFVKTLLHTCWSPDEVLAGHFNARFQVF